MRKDMAPKNKKKNKKEKDPTYHRILTRDTGYQVFIDDINRAIRGVIFNGSLDGSFYWTIAGQILLSEGDARALIGLPVFTIRAHKFIDKKEYILRLLDCSLRPGPEHLLNIKRVIFWRPKAADKKEPRWEYKPTVDLLEDCGT